MAVCEQYTITGSGDGDLTLWDNGESEPQPMYLLRNKLGIHHLAVDRLGSVLAAVSFDGRLHLFDLKSLQPIEAAGIVQNSTDSWAVSLSFDGKFLAVSTVQGLVNFWDLEAKTKKHTLTTNRRGFGMSVAVVRTETLCSSMLRYLSLFHYL